MCTYPMDFSIAFPSIALQAGLDDAEIPDIRSGINRAIASPPHKRKSSQRNRRPKRARKEPARTEQEPASVGVAPNSLVHEQSSQTSELEANMGISPIDTNINSLENEELALELEADGVEGVMLVNEVDKHVLLEGGEQVNALDEQGDEVYSAYESAVLSGIAEFYQIGEGVCVIRGWNTKKNEPTVRELAVKLLSPTEHHAQMNWFHLSFRMAGDETLVTCRCYNCTQTNSECIYKWFFENYRERFLAYMEWTDVGRWSS